MQQYKFKPNIPSILEGKTACCGKCLDMDTLKLDGISIKQECQCTKSRDQIPTEKIHLVNKNHI